MHEKQGTERVDKNARGSLYRFWGREFPQPGRFVAEFQPSQGRKKVKRHIVLQSCCSLKLPDRAMRIERSSVFGRKSFPGEHDHLDRCFQTFGDRPTDRKPLGLFLNWPLTNFGAIEKGSRKYDASCHVKGNAVTLDFQD